MGMKEPRGGDLVRSSEMWNAGGGNNYFYTEDVETARLLRREFKEAAIYENGRGAFAWQLTIPNRRIPRLISLLLTLRNQESTAIEIGGIENQRLTRVRSVEFDPGRTK
jgi:hypothetical protein